jgi:hypothetical protein
MIPPSGVGHLLVICIAASIAQPVGNSVGKHGSSAACQPISISKWCMIASGLFCLIHYSANKNSNPLPFQQTGVDTLT